MFSVYVMRLKTRLTTFCFCTSGMQNGPMQWHVLRISPCYDMCYGLYIVQLYVSKLDVLPKYDCREVEIIQYHSNNVGYGCQARRVFLMR